MKLSITLFAFLLIFNVGHAQLDTATFRKNLYANMDSMMVYFKTNKWDKYVEYMHPALMEKSGGKDSLANLIGKQMEAIGGLELVAFKPGKLLQLFKVRDTLQGVVQSFYEMKIQDVTIAVASYDVVTSTDGVRWTFTTIDNPDLVKMLLPLLSPEMKFPKKTVLPDITLDEFMKTYQIEYF